MPALPPTRFMMPFSIRIHLACVFVLSLNKKTEMSAQMENEWRSFQNEDRKISWMGMVHRSCSSDLFSCLYCHLECIPDHISKRGR